MKCQTYRPISASETIWIITKEAFLQSSSSLIRTLFSRLIAGNKVGENALPVVISVAVSPQHQAWRRHGNSIRAQSERIQEWTDSAIFFVFISPLFPFFVSVMNHPRQWKRTDDAGCQRGGKRIILKHKTARLSKLWKQCTREIRESGKEECQIRCWTVVFTFLAPKQD